MRGLVTIENIRPVGFEYPVGLNAGGTDVVDYLVIAGGGGGGNYGAGWPVCRWLGRGALECQGGRTGTRPPCSAP